MDEAGDKVIWCGGRMDEIDVLHELVKVMSVVFASYPFKARISALSLPTLFCHIIPFIQKDLGTYRQKDISPKQTSYAKPTRADAARFLFQTPLGTPHLPTNTEFSSRHSLPSRGGFG